MAASSNIDQVVAWLDEFARGFNLTRPGLDQSLGRDVANLEVERIQKRAAEENAGPDGDPWPENSGKEPPPGGYKCWQQRKYGWRMPNYQTGQMTSVRSLKGGKTVEKEVVTLRHGENQPPIGVGSPTGLCSEQDKKRTDVQKAEYAHSGGKHGKKRRFYAISDGHAQAIVDLCQESLNELIRSVG